MLKKDFYNYFNPKISIIWHVLFWLAFLLYQAIILGINEGRSVIEELKWAALDLPIQILTTYFTIYFLIPRFFIKKQYLKFVLAFFFSLFLASFLNRAFFYIIYNISPSEDFFNLPKTLKMIFGLYPVVVLGSFMKIGQLWHDREQIHQQLLNDKLESELKFLKAQVNPHFLFNTLNNLYALTLKKSDKASEVVERLSGMLEYLLYEGNESFATVEKELDLLNNYISLEKIRYGDRLEIKFKLEGDINGKKIPPLLLLPFVENSFKHGASQQLEAAWIHIHLIIDDDSLKFNVVNSKKKLSQLVKEAKPNGIGLRNVKKRLDLLFNNDYFLSIMELEEKYQIDLELPLDKTLK